MEVRARGKNDKLTHPHPRCKRVYHEVSYSYISPLFTPRFRRGVVILEKKSLKFIYHYFIFKRKAKKKGVAEHISPSPVHACSSSSHSLCSALYDEAIHPSLGEWVGRYSAIG